MASRTWHSHLLCYLQLHIDIRNIAHIEVTLQLEVFHLVYAQHVPAKHRGVIED